MTTETPATLVVLPGPVPPETVVLGLPLKTRIAKVAERAGFGGVMFVGQGERVGESQALTPALSRGERGRRIVLLAGSVIPKVDWLKGLRETALEPERLYITGNYAAAVDTAQPEAFLSSLADGRQGLDRILLSRPSQRIEEPLGENGRIALAGLADLPRAEKWLLAGLVKDEESFMSRHVERRISLVISRRLASTRVTPNAMTLVSVAVGLLGAALFLSQRTAFQFAGALLFLAHSILDGCDGELARLKFQESRLGGVLDFWGDNLVHSAVFGAIAACWAASVDRPWPLALGAAAILGTILSAGFVYLQTMAPKPREAGPLFTSVARDRSTRLARMADLLARRDFIYLVVILSAFGKARWFLLLAAAGAPLFFLTLLAIAYGRRTAPLKSLA